MMVFVQRKTFGFATLVAVSVLVGGSFRGHAQSSSLPVFPGAQGFGTSTRAAYGGTVAPTVLRVTNLNDSGGGSLRAALTATMPRVVIFETSGTIALLSPINITSPYLTVAGATAPSPGITVRNYQISVRTHDVLIQHLRSRVGTAAIASGSAEDGFNAYTSGASNIVFDHLSVAWSVDGSIDAAAGSQGVTISNCLVVEPLRNAGGSVKQGHARPFLIYDNSQRIAVVRNVTAHTGVRLPVVQGGARAVVVNNLFYDQFESMGTALNDANDANKPIYASIVGNKWIQGPSSTLMGVSTLYGIRVRDSVDAGSKLYRADNIFSGSRYQAYRNDATWGDPTVASAPAEASLAGLTVMPASAVEDHVLANAGARPLDRDSVDRRGINDIVNRTGRYVDNPSDVGGWPTLAVNARALTLPANPHSLSSSGSGYTNLEEWLHKHAAAVEGSPQMTALPPAPPTSVRVVQ